MDYDKLLKLIEVVEKSSLTKFAYKEGDTEIKLEKKCEIIHEVANNLKSEELVSNHIEKLDIAKEDNFEYIKSTLVGTFYGASSLDEKPFISVGDKITNGQVIGIIEAMKMMNEVKSNHDGVVEEILMENEQIVEYGQCLVKVKLS
ncbi:acetyl-CoA carboxylase biotin carboxyl carrier protein [Romboutsia sp.]|uniref:acetyl-CoA carboxylase biotin carboxyl carrier protein n=1 Tax=Romboutsia sp. TaxID=1965302 RepID=UPI003F32CF2F